MTGTRKILQVFVASSGDIPSEREAVGKAIVEVNRIIANRLGYHFEFQGFETVSPGFGRPQELINRLVDQADVFIGLLYKTWGMPPDADGVYSSGFHEEYERTVRRRESAGKPEVALFFKTLSKEQMEDVGEKLKPLLDFKKEIQEKRQVYYEMFSDAYDLGERVRLFLGRQVPEVNDVEGEHKEEISLEANPMRLVDEKLKGSEDGDHQIDFLKQLEMAFQSKDSPSVISAEYIARLRLLAIRYAQDGNDVLTLGVHDSNQIYRDTPDEQLSKGDFLSLLDAGLRYMSGENSPVWKWAAALKELLPLLLALRSASADQIIAGNAIKLIQRLQLTPRPFGADPSSETRKQWIQESLNGGSPDAILGYLAQQGTSEDLDLLRPLCLSNIRLSSEHKFLDAALQIQMRHKPLQTLEVINEFCLSGFSPNVLKRMFDDCLFSPPEDLFETIRHPDKFVRFFSALVMRRKGLLTESIAAELLSDWYLPLRILALVGICEQGRELSDSEIARHLRSPEPMVRAWWLPTVTQNNKLQHLGMQRVRIEILRKLNGKEATAAGRALTHDMILRRLPLFAAHYRSIGELLVAQVEGKLQGRGGAFALVERPIVNAMVENKHLEALEEEKSIREAIDIIVQYDKGRALDVVRRALTSNVVGVTPGVSRYFGRYGQWKDIALLVGRAENSGESVSRGLLAIGEGDARWAKPLAKAILLIGRKRPIDVVQLSLPAVVMREVLLNLPDMFFANCPDALLEQLMNSSDADVRKVASLKIICSKSKAHVVKLLNRVKSSGDFRYYNVLFWLDLGASLPRAESRRVAKEELRDVGQRWAPLFSDEDAIELI